MLPHDRDAVGTAVDDEHPLVPVEHDAARRAERERPLMVVFRHLVELRVLDDLQHPEPASQHDEDRDGRVLKNREANAGGARALFSHQAPNDRVKSSSIARIPLACIFRVPVPVMCA